MILKTVFFFYYYCCDMSLHSKICLKIVKQINLKKPNSIWLANKHLLACASFLSLLIPPSIFSPHFCFRCSTMFVGSWKKTETLSGMTSCLFSKTAGTKAVFYVPCWTHTHTYTFTCSVPHPCRLDFIYDLFEHVGSRNGDETLKMGTARRKPTVSSQFRVRLKLLVMLIRLCAQSGKKGYEIM